MRPAYVIVPAVAVGTGLILAAARTKATAEDLRITVEGMKPFSWKRDVKNGTAYLHPIIGFGNPRGGRISVEAMDLDLYVDDQRIGGTRNYSLDLTIQPVALTTKEIEVRSGWLDLGKALGMRVITAILRKDDAAVKSLWPKEISLRGPIRANGITFQLDERVPFTLA